jgi:hypothetical protein
LKTPTDTAEQRLRTYLHGLKGAADLEAPLEALQAALRRVEVTPPGTASHREAQAELQAAARALLDARAASAAPRDGGPWAARAK